MNTKNFVYFAIATLLIVAFSETLQAVPLESLREPMKAMKNEIWSYMFAIKIGAAVMGCIMSVLNSSLTPLGLGIGISAAIQFFDSIIVNDAAAALVGF
jgi:hypothetical protein